MSRRTVVRIVAIIAIASVVIVGTSVTRYVLAHPNEPLQQNVASWARNNGMGAVVDQLEAWLHNDPPAAAPADTLALVTDVPDDTEASADTAAPTSSIAPSSTTQAPTSTTNPSTPSTPTSQPSSPKTTIGGSSSPAIVVNRPSSASCPSRASDTTTTTAPADTTTAPTSTTAPTDPTLLPGETTTTTSTVAPRPLDITPVVTPGIKGEGEWTAVARVRTKPIVYASSIRPLWCFGSVVATMATYDPNKVRVGLFNGTEVPGGKGWRNGSKIRGSALRSLIASFNGGFRFEHSPGGYVTEGRTVQRMKKGYATFAIRQDGFSTVGIWGRDITDDGTWASLRQNLPPLVEDGKSSYAKYDKVDWGQDFGNKVYNYRSAVCVRADGLMMFVAVGKVNIGMLADTLVFLGCRTGMELDINGTWPFFATYSNFGKVSRIGRTIDTRMGDPQRHLNGATKDFFALFDPETLAPGAVR